MTKDAAPRALLRTFSLPVVLIMAAACTADEGGAAPTESASPTTQAAAPAKTATDEPLVRLDINAAYLDPNLDVDDLAEGFSAENREAYFAREAVTAALGLEPGDVIADIGAGTGIYLEPFANAVGSEGRVYAIDISELLVTYLGRYARQQKLDQVTAVLGETASTTLPPASVDVAFTSAVYHHFEKPSAMNAHLFEVVRPGGRLVVLDFRRGPDAADWLKRHVRTDMAGVIAEITQAGFAFEGEIALAELEDNYLLVFRRPSQ